MCRLLTNLDKRIEASQDVLLSLLIGSLSNVTFPRAIDESSPYYLPFLSENEPETRNIILEFFLDILLSNMESYSTSKEQPAKMTLGMSTRALTRLNSNSAPKTYQQLNEQKLAILNILENHLEHSLYIRHVIVGSTDIYTAVAQRSENMFRVSYKHIDTEDKETIQKLYQFYESGGTGSFKRTAPPMNVKIKIMSIFSRSKVATNMFPSTLRVIFDCAYGNY